MKYIHKMKKKIEGRLNENCFWLFTITVGKMQI